MNLSYWLPTGVIAMEMGLFETMKVVNGKILLADYHFERFFPGFFY